MVPSAIKIMHGFPLTINGKIDRDALKYDDLAGINMGSEKED